MSIGIALSGGWLKGAAHIGVLQALKEENITIDYISGTSSGSIVAALYASGYSPNSILTLFNIYSKQIMNFDKKIVMRLVTNFSNTIKTSESILNGDMIEMIIEHSLGNKKIYNINQIQMPLAIPSVDINTGKIIYFLNKEVDEENNDNIRAFNNACYEYTGSIAGIVRASCSYPVLFSTRKYKGYHLIDGGIRVNTPVSILKKMGADKIISVSFNGLKNNNNCMLNTAIKALDIIGREMNEEEIINADINIIPNIQSSDISNTNCINIYANLGYSTTKNMIKKLKMI
ncbi:MAG: patatin-like phospholipase family protein [Clostridia bacterium]|nr:patatin-like phospholipase family protein [Clostridia bacterium]